MLQPEGMFRSSDVSKKCTELELLTSLKQELDGKDVQSIVKTMEKWRQAATTSPTRSAPDHDPMDIAEGPDAEDPGAEDAKDAMLRRAREEHF